MFKNSVFKPSVNTVEWFKRAGIRSLKTMAQTAVAMVTIGLGVTEVDWINIASVSLVAGIVSLLTSVAGIPEVEEEQ